MRKKKTKAQQWARQKEGAPVQKKEKKRLLYCVRAVDFHEKALRSK